MSGEVNVLEQWYSCPKSR